MDHLDLPADTVVRSVKTGMRLIIISDMRGAGASVNVIRKDGERDRRWDGWSGALSVAEWVIEKRGEEVDTRMSRVLAWLQAQPPGEWQSSTAVQTGAGVRPGLSWAVLHPLIKQGLVEERWYPLFVRATPPAPPDILSHHATLPA